jgi:hypothetical protein
MALGKPSGQLEPTEAGAEDEDVLLHRPDRIPVELASLQHVATGASMGPAKAVARTSAGEQVVAACSAHPDNCLCEGGQRGIAQTGRPLSS